MSDMKVRKATKGDPRILGVTKVGNGYNFAFEITDDKSVSLLLHRVDDSRTEEIIIDEKWITGKVAAVYLPGFRFTGYTYNFKVGDKIFQDPYATVIIGKGDFGKNSPREDLCCGIMPSRPYNWEGDTRLNIPYSQMILYKIHVRGYTKQRNSKVKYRGTFTGIKEKVPYLKELGINTLELMPAYEFQEFAEGREEEISHVSSVPVKNRLNYWGYAPANYFAPKGAYCGKKDTVTEVRDMVKELHKAGIAVIMEFYFPREEDPSLALAALRHWYIEYHVDGFHLLGDGVPAELIRRDSLLRKAKLIFQYISIDMPSREEQGIHKRLAESNEGFKQDMRRFLKSDEDSLENAMMRIRRNPGDYGVINYIVNQDGFTMMDLVSYDAKHNEDNGENNQDGTSYNYSWNCGVEGPSRKAVIRRMRHQQIRNAFLFMMLSQGVPMIYGGDEFCNSQKGNNNAYCQDNETGWVDWSVFNRNKNMVQFVKEAIAFRQKHGVFHQPKELRIMDYLSLGYPDLSYHSNRAWYVHYDNVCRHVGMMYCGDYATDNAGNKDQFLYVAYNFHWETHSFALPKLPKEQNWFLILESDKVNEDGCFIQKPLEVEGKVVEVSPRSIAIFIGK